MIWRIMHIEGECKNTLLDLYNLHVKRKQDQLLFY